MVPADTAEEFGLVPVTLKDQGRTLVVAMSDPLNISATDHLVSLTGGRKIETQLAGASAIRHAISRWYRGEELIGDTEQSGRMRIINNAGNTVVGGDTRKLQKQVAPKSATQQTNHSSERQSAVEVLRGVEETQRRSVAALRAMVELLIEKGVFSRDEYLARVKR